MTTTIDTTAIEIASLDIEDVYEVRRPEEGGIFFGFSGRLASGERFDGDAWLGVDEALRATARAAGSARGMIDIYGLRFIDRPEGADPYVLERRVVTYIVAEGLIHEIKVTAEVFAE